MSSQRSPLGEITRGTTAPNRLRRVDRWLTGVHASLLRSGPAPLIVDLGFGATAGTACELFDRVRALRPDAQVVGVEIDPERVRLAQEWAREGLSFVHGGFDVAVPPARVIRAMNVLRQYPPEQVPAAWAAMSERLDESGLIIDGTCDEIGRRAAWISVRRKGPQALTCAWNLREMDTPSGVAERLPKALIHRNVPGEAIHDFLVDLDACWDRAAPWASYGRRQRFIESARMLRENWPIVGGVARWRLGELTVRWDAISPHE